MKSIKVYDAGTQHSRPAALAAADKEIVIGEGGGGEAQLGAGSQSAASDPVRAAANAFAACWADMSDDDFAAFEAECQERRQRRQRRQLFRPRRRELGRSTLRTEEE